MNALAIQKIAKHYQALNAAIPLHPVRSKSHYKRAVAAMNELLDAGAADESHPLADLAATLGELIGDYDDKHHPLPADLTGIDMLRFLMQQQNLNQADLSELGSQGVVSELLSGKRELNVRHIKLLTERFNLPASTFI
ncbi:MAG: helix-turn-helix domain-containing protein [Rudaea sp.]